MRKGFEFRRAVDVKSFAAVGSGSEPAGRSVGRRRFNAGAVRDNAIEAINADVSATLTKTATSVTVRSMGIVLLPSELDVDDTADGKRADDLEHECTHQHLHAKGIRNQRHEMLGRDDVQRSSDGGRQKD